MMRVVALVCALSGCDAVFGLNSVPAPPDAAGSASPYAFEQTKSAQSTGAIATLMIPLTTQPKARSVLVVAVATFANTPMTVTDSAGNNYTMVGADPASTGGSHVTLFYTAPITTRAPFTVTISTTDVGVTDQISAIVDEYSGPFGSDPLDAFHTHTGSTLVGQTVDSDCGSATTTTATVMVAALTRDFNGDVIGTPDWRLRQSIDLPHAMYAVLAAEDRFAPAETADPIFSSTHDADGTSWACVWATFH